MYGQSLGGNIAYRCVLDLKDKIPFKALTLDGTFLSYRSLARQKASQAWILWPFQPLVWLLMSDAYAPKEVEKRAPIPLLVMHGQLDVVVPIEFGEELFAKAPEPKQFWKVPQGHHGDLFFVEEKSYRKKWLDYLAELK